LNMSESRSHSDNNEAVLRELILRFATFPGDPRTQDPQLLVGQIPEDLPFAFVLAEGSQILGSLKRNITNTEIVLDIPLSPEQAIDFYRDHLHTLGWYEQDRLPGYEQRGFVPAGRGGTSMVFMQEIDGPSVRITAQAGKGIFTDVRVIINRNDPPSFPARRTPMRVRQQPLEGSLSLIPRLIAPVGAKMRGGGSSGGLTSAQTSALLGTDLALSVIATHYAMQLEQVGWTRTGDGSAGPSAWHTWRLQDEMQEAWLGRFFFLQMPDRPQE
jgi:hypothetical protein